jgi:capsular exopolysaccharide synthesis family protein
MELTAKRAELARAQKAHDLIADRVAKLRTEQRAPGRVSLLERAEVPLNPIETFPLKQVAVVTLAGLFLPVLMVVGWERFTRRINAAECLEQRSSLAVLAEVPRLPSRPGPGRVPPKHLQQQLRMFEESIDALATSLLLSKEHGDIKVLAVTSAMAHEGKTSVACRLAASLARASGEATLLIDGDMRSPDVHHRFKVHGESGLAEVLAGDCSPEDAIVADGSENVHLLPAGKLAGNPHAAFSGGRLESLLAELNGRYRHIVIDTAPVLAAGETMVLAKAADACLICAMQDASRTSQVEKARVRLESVGCRLAGIVLNGVPVRHYAYRYGGYAYANA